MGPSFSKKPTLFDLTACKLRFKAGNSATRNEYDIYYLKYHLY